jgi:hypothetical protein
VTEAAALVTEAPIPAAEAAGEATAPLTEAVAEPALEPASEPTIVAASMFEPRPQSGPHRGAGHEPATESAVTAESATEAPAVLAASVDQETVRGLPARGRGRARRSGGYPAGRASA